MKSRIQLLAFALAFTGAWAQSAVTAASVLPAGTFDVARTRKGGVLFEDGSVDIQAFLPGWILLSVEPDASSMEKEAAFVCCRESTVYFRGRSTWCATDTTSIEGEIVLTCETPCEMQSLSLSLLSVCKPQVLTLHGTAEKLVFPRTDGGTFGVSFKGPTVYGVLDTSRWGAVWTTRFGEWTRPRTYEKGETVRWAVRLDATDGLSLTEQKPCEIREGERWVRLETRRDIVPGSALDFSAMGLQDAPAGKYGWLRAVDGHFEFERRPGRPQRFYGVNLCFSANYPEPAVADVFIDRLVRLGYNTIRIHHHDGEWSKSAESRKRLDYLIAKAIKKGLYITTDLYVSREVGWRQIGVDQDGTVDMQLYKSLIGCHGPAFDDWKAFARAFLEHVNPYTRRAYKNEPGLPLVSLINEGGLHVGWASSGKAADPRLQAAWRTFNRSEAPMPAPEQPVFAAFDDWLNARIYSRCSAFVRKLGYKGLLTNDNNGSRHGAGQGGTVAYDYVDNHFYVDHPQFLEKPWRLPSSCPNANPIRTGQPKIFTCGWAKDGSKPFTITEWSFSGPGRFRGLGGILTGARAAQDAWDGLWRFAYSHSVWELPSVSKGTPHYFDCATDPLAQASDRASVCLYLRGDADAGGAETLTTDVETGTMRLVTPKTCGGFAERGRFEAGVVKVEVSGAPATVWASALDGTSLSDASHILLTHLTDVQANGNRYADATRKVILAWGKEGVVVESGVAKVALELPRSEEFDAYALDLSGNRGEKMMTAVRKGHLCLTLETRGASGGRLHYELVRRSGKRGEGRRWMKR